LQVELGATGSVDHVIVKESSGFPRLDAAALATVKRWHCNPATREGKAVRAVAIQPFKFVLEEQ
jgi:protein TonB